jgi:hypothetical protein
LWDFDIPALVCSLLSFAVQSAQSHHFDWVIEGWKYWEQGDLRCQVTT